jgi:hypothetical protein
MPAHPGIQMPQIQVDFLRLPSLMPVGACNDRTESSGWRSFQLALQLILRSRAIQGLAR